jgi:glycosyltransferase involved in cell wall biosynthesis
MHLAVDAHSLLVDRRGIGVYVRAILARLLPESELEITLLLRDLFPRRAYRAIAAEIGGDRFTIARRVPRAADVVWHPWNGTFFPSSRPSVATIHDCVPFVFAADSASARRREQVPFLVSAQRSARIVTVSAFSRAEIERLLGVPGERITVIHSAADPRFVPAVAVPLPERLRGRRYVLFVGADDERKNLVTLVRAWRNRRTRDLDLVCVGSDGGEGTIGLHGLSLEQLRDCYCGAVAVAIPSTYEGFGLPALEAMACGTPVIASRVASLPEVCGDAAFYVDDPLDVDAWSAVIDRVAGDEELRARLRAAGIERAGTFSWDRTAEQTITVLRAVAETG